ncbi:hypothetical protein H1C71_038747, partial [Ictidomys tridecemlineatus]
WGGSWSPAPPQHQQHKAPVPLWRVTTAVTHHWLPARASSVLPHPSFRGPWTGSGPGTCRMLPLLLLPLLWAGSLQEDAQYKLQLQESVTVQAGLCALVPCSFSYPWRRKDPPSKLYISWFREGDWTYYYGPVATNNPYMDVRTEYRNRFHLPGDVRDNNCSLLIRDAKKEDTGSY